jgi:uracil-DNA glycosylase family 4
VGEALGKVEALTGRPFMGDAGGMLQRLLNLLGWSRDSIRLHNVASCRPPGDWFDERAPWYHAAMACPYLEPTLDEKHKVVVTFGGNALKRVMNLVGYKKIRVHDFHGAILREPKDRFWVVPTFHPSFLQRGAHNLIGTVLWDLRQAEEARDHGKPADTGSLVVDPPLDWFHAWVDQAVAARQQDPWAYPLTNDVETPDKAGGKDEGEITNEDRSYQILRQNWSINTDEGGTVPHAGPYIDELRRLYQSPGPIWMWNKEYDFPRQVAAGILKEEDFGRVIDLMWLWHYLHSDSPRGLGFVAPFYSSYGPWKHLADLEPAKYGAIDGLQNHRCGFGVYRDLIAMRMFDNAMRHVHKLHTVALRPAQLVGVKVDRTRLQLFKADLIQKLKDRSAIMQTLYPEALAPLTPKGGLAAPPLPNVLHVKATAFTRKGKPRAGRPPSDIKLDLYKQARVVEKLVLKEVLVCKACGEKDVHRKHRCKVAVVGKDGVTRWKPSDQPADITVQVATVTRWYWQEPFNPDSWQQVLAYIKHKKHQPGRAKKTHKESTDRETLERLEKQTKDPFYTALLDHRAINKVEGTYVEGTERRLDSDDRVHPVPTFKPSMGRKSYVDPNITNVVADKGVAKGGRHALAAGFRKCIVASPGCRLLEVDFRAIEAIKVGHRAQDPDYMRLAKLGVHSGMLSYVLGTPFDRTWLYDRPDDLRQLFAEYKKKHVFLYDQTKHYVHAKNYGLTLMGMLLQYPTLFPNLATAQKFERLFHEMAPKVTAWQRQTQERAHRDKYLGGPGDHPYGTKLELWSVFTFKRLTAAQYYRLIARYQKAGLEPPITIINGEYFKVGPGEDAKRALAFYPQSIGAGDLDAVNLELFDPDSPYYIGDAYYGRTPLRAPIHDSDLFEIPHRVWDRVLERICLVMQRPLLNQPMPLDWGLGPFLSNEISAKVGDDWQDMEDLQVPGFSSLDPSLWTAAEEEDEEDGSMLRRSA